ncbi:hypothetical protein [Streptomyces sp. NPDC088270]|uniref:hypothetical protein n=1 Tax=Streptomyces sp. NPDC088270 TaxID=3160990 RepID=UPI00343E9FEA
MVSVVVAGVGAAAAVRGSTIAGDGISWLTGPDPLAVRESAGVGGPGGVRAPTASFTSRISPRRSATARRTSAFSVSPPVVSRSRASRRFVRIRLNSSTTACFVVSWVACPLASSFSIPLPITSRRSVPVFITAVCSIVSVLL